MTVPGVERNFLVLAEALQPRVGTTFHVRNPLPKFDSNILLPLSKHPKNASLYTYNVP